MGALSTRITGEPMPTFDTPEPISTTIELGLGDVRISAGERTDTVVEIEPNDPSSDEDRKAAERTRVDFASGQVSVKAPKLGYWLPRRTGGSINVRIELPAGSNVRVSAGMADVRCDGTLGECVIKAGVGRIQVDGAQTLNVKSGAGDVVVDRVSGHAEITTGSGDVRVRGLGDSAVIKNSNRDTWVGVADGDLRVSAANGSIAVDVANASVVAKSANGDVRLGEAVRGSVQLESGLGEVEVGIREGTAAWLDVNATAGKVHNALDGAEGPGPSAETVEVRARTSVGDVVIRRP
jgi:DUF4097 and DUF4098 domain-containing protein YvlB